MVAVSIVGGMIPICLGIYVLAAIHLFWTPLFLFMLGITIFTINSNSLKIIGICAGITFVLYVISYFAEPAWLSLLLKQVSWL
jgi:hypothetical protein